MTETSLATSDEAILSCHAVMRQLRPHHEDAERFLERVRLQQEEGYELAMLSSDDKVVAVAGYRIGNNLAWGKYLYVDDLVTDDANRSAGHGRELMRWLLARAAKEDCDELHLDSGVQRFKAHRFYLREGMDITSHHFTIRLRGQVFTDD